MKIVFGANKVIVEDLKNINELQGFICHHYGLDENDFYLISNGKIVNSSIEDEHTIHIAPRLVGGKGGFGSMLRAIGAQIEKTTNREACRDLSGRRLRDINEEQRLKNWIATQAEREKEAIERKQKKLERLCQTPKHEFKDEHYDKERSALPEKVEEAVEEGFKAASSSKSAVKRKSEENMNKKKKKPRLWVDAEVEDELSSSCSEDSDDDSKSKNSPAENLCSHDGSESNDNKILQLDNDKTGESSSANCTELKEQDTEIPNK